MTWVPDGVDPKGSDAAAVVRIPKLPPGDAGECPFEGKRVHVIFGLSRELSYFDVGSHPSPNPDA